MATRVVRIGAIPDAFAYDDGDFSSALETDHPIAVGAPVNPDHVVRLEDIPELLKLEIQAADAIPVVADADLLPIVDTSENTLNSITILVLLTYFIDSILGALGDTELLFNDGGAFAGFGSWNGTDLNIPGNLNLDTGRLVQDSITYQYSGTKVLTNGVATALFDIAVSAGEFIGGILDYSIFVTDGTDHQAHTGTLMLNAVNKAGTVSNDLEETYLPAAESEVTTSGTLTDNWTITNGTNKITLNLNANSSLTPSAGYPLIHWTLILHGANVVTPV